MNDELSAKEIDRILEYRAQKASRVVQRNEDEQVFTRVAIVSVGKARFGLPLDKLTLIIKTPPIAVMPRMSPIIRGLVHIRGELIGVIDIARWFDIPSGQQEHLAVVEERPRKLGLLVDRVLGFKGISYKDLAEGIDDDTRDTGHPVGGTTKDLIALININSLFESPAVKTGFSTLQP